MKKKVFKTIFWRQFQLLGCMSHTRMQGIGYGWTLAPVLKMIYKDEDDYLTALKRESMFFNTTQALAPFIMGLTVSMEKENAENKDFDVDTINGIKCGLINMQWHMSINMVKRKCGIFWIQSLAHRFIMAFLNRSPK